MDLLFVLVVVVVLPFVVLGGFRLVARLAERIVLARASGAPALQRRAASSTTLGLGLLAIVGSLVATALPQLGLLPEGPASGAFMLGTLAMLAGWVVHTVPGHRRGFKYGLIVVGLVLLALRPMGRGASRFARGSGDDLLVFGFLGWELVSIGIALAIALLVIRPDQPLEGPSGKAAHAWYRRLTVIQGADLGSLVVWFLVSLVGLGPAYLLVRFSAKAKLDQRPFLYLRSFRQETAPRVFAEVVGPALTRRGTFVGLVHATQTQSSLQSGVPLLWSSNFGVVGDDHWQDWVIEALGRAKGVILDVSGDTPGLQWEIEQTLRRVDRSRVLVLRDAEGPPIAEGVAEVVYDFGERLDEARAEVAAFGSRVNEADVGVVDPAPRGWTTRRRFFGGFDIAFAFAAVLFMLSAPAVALLWNLRSGASVDQLDVRRTLNQAQVLEELVVIESLRHGRTSCDGLVEAIAAERGRQAVEDAWDTPMRLDCADGPSRPTVRSAGPDRTFGTDDDLASQ